MINISHVKKYEQYTLSSVFVRIAYLFLFCSVLTFTSYPGYSKDNDSFNTNSKQEGLQNPSENTDKKNNQTELPLEITEKFYKKDAILKFNEAVKEWDLKHVEPAIKLWTKALNLDSRLWVAYLGLGQAYEGKKEYKKSLDSYSKYLELAPKAASDRQSVIESVKYLSHLLRNGEEAITADNYLSLVKTKHLGKEHYVRWDLNNSLKIYFYPAEGVPNYRKEFQSAFLEGAMIWQEALPNLKFKVIDNSILNIFNKEIRDKKEKELIDQAQIKIIFPSRFKVKGDPNNPIASQIDAQSFPVIRDKKNFRVLGVIMISPYIYYQSQIAVPLEPLSKLKPDAQIKKLKIIASREIGHILGLWGFSPNPDDLMFEGEVSELKLSNRDKKTIQLLYELDPEKEEIVTND